MIAYGAQFVTLLAFLFVVAPLPSAADCTPASEDMEWLPFPFSAENELSDFDPPDFDVFDYECEDGSTPTIDQECADLAEARYRERMKDAHDTAYSLATQDGGPVCTISADFAECETIEIPDEDDEGYDEAWQAYQDCKSAAYADYNTGVANIQTMLALAEALAATRYEREMKACLRCPTGDPEPVSQ